MEENKRIQGENKRLRKKLKEARSQSVRQSVQGSMARDEVRRVMFREENAELGGYASVQMLKADEEDRSGARMELQRPSTSEYEDLIEVIQQENEDMTLMLLNKISTLKARVHVSISEFREIVSWVTKSPFSKRIVDIEAPSKYIQY